MKRRVRRWLFIGLPMVLLAVFFVLQALSLYRLYQIQHEKQLQAPGNNVLWVVSQAQVASLELRYQLAHHALKGQTLQPLVNAYRVFLSRLQLMREGPQWRQMEDLGLQEVLLQFEHDSPQIGALLERLGQDGRAAVQRLDALLQPLDQQLARAASQAMVEQWDALGAELEASRRELRHTIVLMLAILCVGTLLGVSLVKGRRKAWQQAWQLRMEKAFSQHVVGSSMAAVITVDPAGCCTAFNPAAERLFAKPARRVLGRPLPDSIGFFAQSELQQALRQGVSGGTVMLPDQLLHDPRSEDPLYLEVRISTLRDGQNEILGAVVVAYDITEQYVSRRELALHRNHLEQLVRERTRELDEALQRERNAAELYQHFAAMVSHQFRTPLAIVDSSLQRLIRRAGQLTAVEVRDRAQRAREGVERLARLVDSTLGAARLDAGQIDTCPEACDLVRLVQVVCDQYAENCRMHITTPSTAEAWCDPVHLEHILCNLVNNTCKYAHDDVVELEVVVEEQAIVCRISNPGEWPAGVDPDRAFELYWRASNTSGQAGLGIGLYMARELACLQNGSLRIDLTSAGWISFVLTVPRYQGGAS